MKNFILFIFLFLTGCGFKLSGNYPLAPNLHSLYIETKDPYGNLAKNLEMYFKTSNVIVQKTPSDAETIFEILSETTSQQLLAINPTQQNGETRVYNLILTVVYQIKDSKGKVLVSPQVTTQTTTLTIQYDQILAGSNQADNLYQMLRQRIIRDIMNRISSKEITALLGGTKP